MIEPDFSKITFPLDEPRDLPVSKVAYKRRRGRHFQAHTKLARVMLTMGITPKDVIDATGIGERTMQKYIAGDLKPGEQNMPKLLAFLQVEEEDIVERHYPWRSVEREDDDIARRLAEVGHPIKGDGK